LLKGHRPIIATPKGELWINPHGNDALGKGGSGDVLTGLIASLVSQQKDPLKAMLCASYYHATAAEELGKETSNYGVTPMDIIHAIPVLFGRT
jgi:NAD(P)H-hydrate epimerase